MNWLMVAVLILGAVAVGVALAIGKAELVASLAVLPGERLTFMHEHPDIPLQLLGAGSFYGLVALGAYACWSLDRLCSVLWRGAVLDMLLLRSLRRFVGAYLVATLYVACIYPLMAILIGYPDTGKIVARAFENSIDTLLFSGIIYAILHTLAKGLDAIEENSEFI